MPPKTKGSSKNNGVISSKSGSATALQEQNCYEGERFTDLLKSTQRAIESAKLLDKTSLPEKIWFKQQFSIGVNDVTRVLERMRPSSAEMDIGSCCSSDKHRHVVTPTNCRLPSVRLQVVLVASDCNPRWLVKHLPNLAASRNVPIIYVRDKKGGSLRLGELVKLKTAIAIGVKDKGNPINQIMEDILQGNEKTLKECLKLTVMPAATCQ